MFKAEFKKKLTEVLDSETFALAMKRGLANYRKARQAGISEEEFTKLREELKSCKDAALARLPQLIEQFTEEAKAALATVHFAETAEKAREIITGIAESHDAKLIVESKSMISEEIELNSSLREKGIEVVETDLSYRVKKSDGELSSHVLAPTIHATRQEVTSFFSNAQLDLDERAKTGRPILREKCISADIGISEACIGLAPAGAIVIADNIGDVRIVSSLSPIHIVLLGIENIVPSIDHVPVILKALNYAATGQKMAVYTCFIRGASRTGDIEFILSLGMHGPTEVHIVLLDNGRLAMAQDPIFKDTLRCVNCFACADASSSSNPKRLSRPIDVLRSAFGKAPGYFSTVSPRGLDYNAAERACPAGIPMAKIAAELQQRSSKR
jgi:L-lactate dehydrogenase complex protein LldF